MLYEKIKRFVDILIAIIGIILLSPIYIILIILLKIKQGSPIFFSQIRIGKNGGKFAIYKFRTMKENAEELKYKFTNAEKKEYEENFKLEKDSRVTQLGKYLRKSCLDELPQLWNILKGDMSFIGPRPIVEEELKKYRKNKEKLLSVKPGLTGYWQAYAKKGTTYEERIKMELYYIENQSLLFDIKIFGKTMKTILEKISKK